jgi:uncharacterized protein (TIGR03083 family)
MSHPTEDSSAPWFRALRHSHEVLRDAVQPLTADQLTQRSYAAEWSIAQVLSHLGSQAEIFGMFLDAGLTGEKPPGREDFGPIWAVWDGKEPQVQASDALRADLATLERFEALTDEQKARFRMNAFGTELDITGVARMRLSEHAAHTWDVAVALDPAATVQPDAVALLIDGLGQLVGRTAKPDGKQRTVHVITSDPERHFLLETGDAVTLNAADTDPDTDTALLRLPAEQLIRLVYGRLGPGSEPAADLRPLFPGF